jgi:hypothetical protein
VSGNQPQRKSPTHPKASNNTNNQPNRNTLTTRRRFPHNLPHTRPAASSSVPYHNTHKVATANANQIRSKRPASRTSVRGHDHPNRFKSRNPCSIQLRYRYHTADASCGGRSVNTSHASFIPRAHSVNTVHSKVFVLNTRHRPFHCVPRHGASSCNTCHADEPSTSTLPSPPIGISGCAPNCRM